MKIKYGIFILLLVSSASQAVTVTSMFEITNRTIEKETITSTDTTMNYSTSGNGLYKIADNYQDANINALDYGNQQLGLKRGNSLISFVMTGQKLGHQFLVQGKYADSSISAQIATGAWFNVISNNGCSDVQPRVGLTGTVTFKIMASDDVSKQCIANTPDYTFQSGGSVPVTGINRTFLLDIGRLQNDPAYRKAPPDIYIGSGVFNGERIKNRVGNGFLPAYTNNITIVKNPYFEGVTLSSGSNVFDTKTVGNNINGNLVVPYVINGHFTPYNTITLQIRSANGFRLKNNGSAASIPYSLSTTIGSQRVYSLVSNGTSSGQVVIKNLESESYVLQGRFDADFSIDKNNAVTGDYDDTLTAIFQVTL